MHNLPKTMSRLLFFSGPIVNSGISILDGALNQGILQFRFWCAVTVSTLEGNLISELFQIGSWCVAENDLAESMYRVVPPDSIAHAEMSPE